MAAYEVDVLVSIRTTVEHPGLNDEASAASVGTGRIGYALRQLRETEAISDFTILTPIVSELT